MANITIAGHEVQIEPRFSAGHVLSENEANQMNQVFFENVRNNLAAKLKETSGDVQPIVDEYAKSYEFGARSGGGGRTSDPVKREALRLAREAVIASLKRNSKDPKGYTASQITDAARRALDTHPEFMEQARRNVESMPDIDLDLGGPTEEVDEAA